MLELALIDMIKERHGPGPRTHNRSKDEPIDCYFGSPCLHISKGGYLPFGRLQSDHRGLWLDLKTHQLFGHLPPPIHHPDARRLKMEDPRVVAKYIELLTKYFEEHNLFGRMNKLHTAATYPLPQHLRIEYEEIDKIAGELMDKAEKKCRKLHTGEIPWSPAYKKICLILQYWHLRKAYINSRNTNVRQLIVLQNKLKITYDCTLTKEQILEEIKFSNKQRIKIKKMAESLSLEFRTRLAMAKEEAGEVKAAVYLRNRNRIEGQRRVARNIKRMEGKAKGGSTTQITTTNSDGIVTEYTQKVPIERVIANSNDINSHQTEGGSQLLTPTFITELGSHGEGPLVTNVLNGTYIPPEGSSLATRDFLSACKAHDNINELPATPDICGRYHDTKKLWKLRRESTCTYNQHMGHYQAAMQDNNLSCFFFSGVKCRPCQATLQSGIENV